jgi:hypothetical protein
MNIPIIINSLGPNLSTSPPISGDSIPRAALVMLVAIDVTVRLNPNSEAIGLNNAENP